MILDGQVLGRPLISYKDTQTAIEALTGVVEGMTAYATDTDLTGYYTGVSWVWLSSTSGSYVPIVHDIAGAYHSTSGRTTNQVLQATGATTFGWSTNTLSIDGNSTVNGSLVGSMTGGGTVVTGGFTATIPATGTVALLGITRTSGYLPKFDSANAISNSPLYTNGTGIALGTTSITSGVTIVAQSGTLNTVEIDVYSNSLNPTHLFARANGTLASPTKIITNDVLGTFLFRGYSEDDGDFVTGASFSVQAIANFDATNRGTFLTFNTTKSGTTSSPAQRLKLYDVGALITGSTTTANNADQIAMTVTGFTTQATATSLVQFTRNDANTNAVATMLGLNVNTTGTAAAGFGGAIALNLESASTADQVGGRIAWLWNVATHVSAVSDVVLSAAYNSGAAIVESEFLRGRGNAGIIVTGSQTGTYTTTAVDLTLTAVHHWVRVTVAKTITLPTAVGISGREYLITATVNNVIVDAATTELINGSLTQVLMAGDSMQIKSDGAGWLIV